MKKQKRKANEVSIVADGTGSFYEHPRGVMRKRYYACCRFSTDLGDVYIVQVTDKKTKADRWLEAQKNDCFISMFYVSTSQRSEPKLITEYERYPEVPDDDA